MERLSKKSCTWLMIIALQCKFLLVWGLNITYQLIPNPLRNYYLRLFGVSVEDKSSIHRGCKFFHVGKFRMGKRSVINFGCYLDNRRGIYIGNNVGIAHDTKIYTLGHDINDPKFQTRGAPVRIKDNAFIFSNVLILPGVTIGEGAIVLPGSVVTKSVEPWTIAGGNPAKKIRDRNHDINYSQVYRYWFAL